MSWLHVNWRQATWNTPWSLQHMCSGRLQKLKQPSADFSAMLPSNRNEGDGGGPVHVCKDESRILATSVELQDGSDRGPAVAQGNEADSDISWELSMKCFTAGAMSEEQSVATASRARPSRKEISDGWISDRQGPKALPSMSLFTSVSLHVCLCHFSLGSGMVCTGMGRSHWPQGNVIISWKYPVPLGVFTCRMLWRGFPPKLYCVSKAMILCNNSANLNNILMI